MACHDDMTVRHLEMIQAVITRQAGNSFALKAITGTLTAAILAYAASASEPSHWFAIAGLVPVVAFWHLDAMYLRQERLFRALYDAVRKGEHRDDGPFSMDLDSYLDTVPSTPHIAFTWSVLWFYAVLALILVALAFTL